MVCIIYFTGKSPVDIGKQIEEEIKESCSTGVPVVDGLVIPVVNYSIAKKVDEASQGCCGNHGAEKCKKQKIYLLG